VILSLCATCRAENICPWLNAATAFGALEGSTGSPATRTSEITATTCTFTYREGNVLRELRIDVDKKDDAAQEFTTLKGRCHSDMTPLRAIGNEAVMCVVKGKDHMRGEEVLGRVRDNVFKVSVSVRGNKSKPEKAIEETARSVAEEVAGNLF
jgi:hypothetical protein